MAFDRNRYIEKIQKLLAMHKDGRGNEEEMSTALRMAQRMMEVHGISEKEVGLAEFGYEKVHCPVQAGKKFPEYLMQIVYLMKSAFGVDATINSEIRVSDPSWVITYIGRNDRITLAGYAHVMVFRAATNGWNQYLRDNPHMRKERGARSGFIIGFTQRVRRKVEDIGISEEERADIEAQKMRMFGRKLGLQEVSEIEVNPVTQRAGFRAAEDFSLHRPLN
jgi:hypothetical protein